MSNKKKAIASSILKMICSVIFSIIGLFLFLFAGDLYNGFFSTGGLILAIFGVIGLFANGAALSVIKSKED